MKNSTALLILTITLVACNTTLTVTGQPTDHLHHTEDQLEPETIAPQATGLWSNPSTWPYRKVPTQNASVVIPQGSVITLDQNIDVQKITVQGTLICANTDLNIRTKAIEIDGGTLQCGTPHAPFSRRLKITLTPENTMHIQNTLRGMNGSRYISVLSTRQFD